MRVGEPRTSTGERSVPAVEVGVIPARTVESDASSAAEPAFWNPPMLDGRVDYAPNPKEVEAQKTGKAPMDKLVLSILEEDARVHDHGAAKYGERNWRIDAIKASTYEGAILRHFLAFFQGEDNDPDSGISHLAHIRACCAVLRDAQINGKLIDDRDRKVSGT